MIDGLRLSLRGGFVVKRQLLDRRPVGQQPGLEVMLCRVWMEPRLVPDPLTHLGLGVCGIVEVGRLGPRVDVRQSDDVIRASLQ